MGVLLAFLRTKAGMALAGALVLSLALGVATWRVYAWGYGEAERAAELAVARLEAQRLLVLRSQELRTARLSREAAERQAESYRAEAEAAARAGRQIKLLEVPCAHDIIPLDVLPALDPDAAAADGLR